MQEEAIPGERRWVLRVLYKERSSPPLGQTASHHTHSYDDDGFPPFGLRPIDTLFLSPALSPRSNIYVHAS